MTCIRLVLSALGVLSLWAGVAVRPAQAETPPTHQTPAPLNLFDPARHMHISEVKPGMTGYGLTVFKGTKIERFEVEVLSVLMNFNAKSDVILIRCKGDYLEHTGSIAGMSGSPIYLTDASGHARMIGAFAYGWPLTKDPIAGVQPIEYMLKLPLNRKIATEVVFPATQPSAGARNGTGSTPTPHGHAAWSLKDAGMLPVRWQAGAVPARAEQADAGRRAGHLLGDGEAARIEPLATPLMTAGMSPRLFAQLAPQFRAAGLSPLQAGIGGSSGADQTDAKLEPGSVLAVPLLTGDLEMTAIGTATEVLGDRVWGFGHPFNNEGPISLPMGSGIINGIIANLNTSFKLGSLTKTRGTLTTDGSVGVAGETGAGPSMIPIDITVQPCDGSPSRTYHFDAARHAKFTPMIAAAAVGAAVTGSSDLPQFNTIDYDLRLTFTDGQTVDLANRTVNATGADLFGDAGIVMQAASDNPFQRVLVKKITGTFKIRSVVASAQIVDVNLPKSKYRPGEKIKAFVTYQPFQGTEAILPVDLDLPHDLPPGPYQFVISDAQRYFQDEQQSKPFRFMADSIGDVFAVLKDVGGIRENAIYVRLLRHPDGVAIGHTALAHLPSSRREILLTSGRSNMTPFVSSTVKIVPTELVMAGASEFMIEVESLSKVVGAPRVGKPESPLLSPKGEDVKKTATVDAPAKKETP